MSSQFFCVCAFQMYKNPDAIFNVKLGQSFCAETFANTLTSFQSCMVFFILWNKNWEIMKNVLLYSCKLEGLDFLKL